MEHLRYPNESTEYRAARNALLNEEIARRAQIEAVAAKRRALPMGGEVPEDYAFERIGKNSTPEKVKMSELFGLHAEVRFQALEAWTRNLIPAAQGVTHRWSGQVLDTIDYAGFIGKNPGNNNIYVHTGDSGQGMTHGAVGAMVNSALILGREARWAEVYEPSRKTLAGMSNFLRENMTAVKNFAEYLAPGELSDVSDLKAGHGAIIRPGMSKIAAYRDPSGKHMRALPPARMSVATCTGIPSRRAGIAPVTDLILPSTARRSMPPPSGLWPRRTSRRAPESSPAQIKTANGRLHSIRKPESPQTHYGTHHQ